MLNCGGFLELAMKKERDHSGQTVAARFDHQSWSMDFMSDSGINGRKFRTLNVIDDCSGKRWRSR